MYVIRRKEMFNDAFIYIHVGPVRFTRMHRTSRRREVQLITQNARTLEQIFQRWETELLHYNIIPIICTLYPMEFKIFNNYLAGNNGRQILRGFYQENNRRIKAMVVEENRTITKFNDRLGNCTPFMHKHIFTRRRGRYHFRSWMLRDGLHPRSCVVARWIRELRRITSLNMHKWRYYH